MFTIRKVPIKKICVKNIQTIEDTSLIYKI